MGLPIWRNPEEETKSQKAAVVKNDRTAHSRSPIRRRPSVHGRRDGRPQLARERSTHSPASTFPQQPYGTLSRLNEAPQGARIRARGVPPIATLLESADRHAGTPPPAPDARDYIANDGDGLDGEAVARARRIARRAGLGTSDSNEDLLRDFHRDFLSWTPDTRRAWVESHWPPAFHQQGYDIVARMLSSGPTSTVSNPSQPRRFLDVVGHRDRLFRSPSPLNDTESRSVDGGSTSNATAGALPTPPHEQSLDSGSLFVPPADAPGPRPNRRSHPLSNSWRPESPIDGLGDRNRSPTPADGWEMMRSTIMPDTTLPSADSSFTSAAASNSFSSSNDDTTITAPTESDVERSHRRNDLLSTFDLDELLCADDDDEDMMDATEAFAEDMFFHELTNAGGRERIREQELRREVEGNRFALEHESDRVDIGFRLIEAALDTDEGRQRLMQIRSDISSEEARDVTRERESAVGRRRTRGVQLMDTDLSTNARAVNPPARSQRRRPRDRTASEPELGDDTDDARELLRTDYGSSIGERVGERAASGNSPNRRAMSPPSISVDAPQPHPVSPPTQRSEIEASDSFSDGEVHTVSLQVDSVDLESMRRIVERLAQRDDVPDEWWMSMGVILPRTSPRPSDDGTDSAVRRVSFTRLRPTRSNDAHL